jgi:hypothetical protein
MEENGIPVAEAEPDDAFTWRNRGFTLLELGQGEEEVECCDRAPALDPTDDTAQKCRYHVCGQVTANKKQ